MKKIQKKNDAAKDAGKDMKAKQADAIAQLKAHDKKPADIVKDESVPAAAAAAAIVANAEQSKTAEPALTLPPMTAEFCLQDQKYWDSKDDMYNPESNECKACSKDFPEQPKSCAARTAYLQSLTGKKKTASAKTPRAKAVKADGAPNQTDLINGLLKASTPLEAIVTAVAAAHYGGSAETAKGRIARHIKSIVAGTCKSATEMKPFLAYLTPKPADAAPAAPAAS